MVKFVILTNVYVGMTNYILDKYRLKFLLASFIIVILAGCGQKFSEVSLRGQTMGTTYAIKVYSDNSHKNPISSADLKTLIDSALVNYNQIMSTYIPDSEISLFNQAPLNTWVDVSPYFFYLLSLSAKLNLATQGEFDVTIGPVVELYGFGRAGKKEKLPSPELISQALKNVGQKYLVLDDTASIENVYKVKRLRSVSVDLSAIAKGHATDVIAMLLDELGFKHYLIEIGGELFASGLKAGHTPWSIGVEKPALVRGDVAQAIAITNKAVATSGDYRNFYDIKGVRIAHTMSPLTGKPVNNDIVSVTVVAQTGAEADAWATALNVLGSQKALKICQQNALAAYFILSSQNERDINNKKQDKEYNVQHFTVKSTAAFEPYLLH